MTCGLSVTAAAGTSDPLPVSWAALANDAALRDAGGGTAAGGRQPAHASYAVPALEIVGFDTLLNLYDRHFLGSDFDANLSTIRRNLRSSWVTDRDPFEVNQLGHPYQGSMYHGFARSSGFGFWTSLGYTFAGSAFWEIAGEATPPSRNDQITTGIGGAFLGEPLYRMAHLVLEHDEIPPFWRELAAAAVSPATGFNRLVYGDRYDGLFDARHPAHYTRLQFGFSGTAQNNAGTATTRLRRNEALVDFSIDYGLPGQPGYGYKRPFDYFALQATASSANGVENVLTRGLLLGRSYEIGSRTRGIWGLYGSYDYIAPQTFRVAATALSLGTTGQWWMTDTLALQGSVLAGAGYASVGSVRSSFDGDYHYGIAPQALVALRLVVGDRASLDLTGREYFVTRLAAAERGGHDNIVRVEASLVWRVHGRHGIGVRYLANRRDASYPDLGDVTQTRATIGLFYTLLGRERFSAVEWR